MSATVDHNTDAAGRASLTGDYEIDRSNSRIGFSARYAMITDVSGAFHAFSGQVHLDGEDPTRSETSMVIFTASLETGQVQRDEHLKSADFLDAETFPQMRFVSTSVQPVEGAGRDSFLIHGELTVRKVTRPVDVAFTLTGTAIDPVGQRVVGFRGAAAFSRGDFGLYWNKVLESGGVLVGDEVTLSLDVTLTKTSAYLADPEDFVGHPLSELHQQVRRRFLRRRAKGNPALSAPTHREPEAG